MRRVPELDSLRGLALLAVMVAGTPRLGLEPFGVPTSPLGRLGAGLFFALAGYLLTAGLLAGPPIDGRLLWRRLGRRALRVGPTYYVALGVALLVAAGEGLADPARALPWYLFFTEGLPRGGSGDEATLAPFAHAWGVAVVVQFALVWPSLVALAGRRRVVPLALALAAAGWALRATGREGPLLLVRGEALALGAALVPLVTVGGATGRPVRVGLGLMGGIGLGLALGGPWLPGLARSIGPDLVAAALVGLAAAGAGGRWLAPLRLGPLPWLGRITLGAYLFHGLYFDLLGQRIPGRHQTLAQTALVYALTLLTASLARAELEAPFLDAADRLDDAGPPPA